MADAKPLKLATRIKEFGTGDTVSLDHGGSGATTAVGSHDAFSTIGADIASATTTDIGAATGFYLNVTGSATITGLGTAPAGTERLLRVTGSPAPLFTYNATSLILPGSANIQAVDNDRFHFISLGGGNWFCFAHIPAIITGTGFDVRAANPIITGVLTVTGYGTFTTGNWILNKAGWVSPADGVFSLTGWSGFGSPRLTFGDATIAYPALVRSGTTLKVRLGDDSADAAITAETAAVGTNTTQLATTAFVRSNSLTMGKVLALAAGGAMQ